MVETQGKLLKVWNIGKLTIAIYNYWLGFGYKEFESMGKRKDFGFIKFWWGR